MRHPACLERVVPTEPGAARLRDKDSLRNTARKARGFLDPVTASAPPAGSLSSERRQADRRERNILRLQWERRSGFDRRRRRSGFLRSAWEDTLRYLHEHPFAVALVLLLLNTLNLLDAVLTIEALKAGAREANPIMEALFQSGTAQALVFKLLLIAALSGILWGMRRFKLGLVTALAAAGTYILVAAYHMALALVM